VPRLARADVPAVALLAGLRAATATVVPILISAVTGQQILIWAALGGWHGDSIVDLGAMLAGVVLGAKRGEALRSFDTALVKEPTSPVYPTYYAFTLLRMDAGNAPRARALLERAVALKPRDGFEALMRYRAAQALAPLQRGDIKAARALVPKLQPFGKLAG